VDVRSLPAHEVDVQPVNGFDGATDTNVFDTNAWVLPVRLAAPGIDASAPSAPLHFRVVVHGEYGPPGGGTGTVDATEEISTFDPLAAPLGPVSGDPGALLVPADAGTTLTVPGAGSTPLLVLLGQNGSGDRVTVLGGSAPPALPAAPGGAESAAGPSAPGTVGVPTVPAEPQAVPSATPSATPSAVPTTRAARPAPTPVPTSAVPRVRAGSSATGGPVPAAASPGPSAAPGAG
jgi:hypothetical protein